MSCKKGDLVRHNSLSYQHTGGNPLGLVGMVVKLWPSTGRGVGRSQELAQIMWLGTNSTWWSKNGQVVPTKNLSVFRKETEMNP